TPTMDGCCLSISGGVSPIVTHANYKNTLNPTVADESLTMSKIRGHHHITLGGNVNRSLKKSQYAASHAEKTQGINKLVTVIGFRDPQTNAWEFYWQRRRVDANNPTVGIILEDRFVRI